MTARPAGEHWNELYAEKPDDAVSWFQERPEPSLRLLRAASRRPGSVIDVGGGRSGLAQGLIAAGWSDVTVLDVSAEALRGWEARADSAAVEFVQADIRTWQPDRARQLWHDRAVFHFLVDADDRSAYVRAATTGVAPGGALVLGTFAPDGPDQCSGLPTARYAAGELAEVFAGGFHLEATEQHTHTTPWGTDQNFTWVVLRRS
ncbi:MAG: class I SAM-dependent methyltransferase [Candidatus Nanopelagicales bacterium]